MTVYTTEKPVAFSHPLSIICSCEAVIAADDSAQTWREYSEHKSSAEHRARRLDQYLAQYSRKTFAALKRWVHVESTFQTGNSRTEAFEQARDLVAEIQRGFTEALSS